MRSMPKAVRVAVVVALALAGSALATCSALVNRDVESDPAAAARVWPGHPRVKLSLALGQIGADAAAGRAPSPTTIARAMDAARQAPLAVEPFLIGGALAQSRGRADLAEPLLVEALRRDPRSASARFLLAERYLTTGRPTEGLRQTAALGRVVPGAAGALVPALSQYARLPASWPAMRRMFLVSPNLREQVLEALAGDGDNYPAIMALAGDALGARANPVPAWQPRLIDALMAKGQFDRARALWLKISGLRSQLALVFNPGFAQLDIPAPFNWTFASGDFGIAEPAAGGLQVMYYGRADAQFASQTLLLAPGAYQIAMPIERAAANEGPSGLAWTIACLPGGKPLVAVPIGDGVSRTVGGRFVVPANCPSQAIRLIGQAPDVAIPDQVTVRTIALTRVAS